MIRIKTLFLLVFVLAFCSCEFKQEDTFARQFIDILRRGDLARASALLSSEIPQDNLSWLGDVCRLLSQGEVKSFNDIGSNFFKTAGRSREAFTYELEYPNEWVLVEVVVDEANGVRSIAGLHTYRSQGSWKEANTFRLSGKPTSYFIMLALIVAVAVFSLVVLAICIRTKVPRKWAWILFIILGVGKVAINWTTGIIDYQVLTTQLLSVSASKGGLYPQWILSISLPIGAIVFLLKRHSLTEVRQIRLFESETIHSTGPGA